MKIKSIKTKLAISLGAVFATALVTAGCLAGGTAAFADGSDVYGESYRNKLAFSAKEGWNNDPNGLLYADGVYHMYYQYNWDKNANGGAGKTENVWGHMSWGHATSTDLVHWIEQPVALPENTVGADGKNYGMMFSGSAVYDETNTSGLFETENGKVKDGHGIAAVLTQPDDSAGGQRQILAYSKDDGASFEIYGEVLGANAEGSLGDGEFRDPKIFWNEKLSKWLMVVGGGAVRMYSSADLKNWDYLYYMNNGTSNALVLGLTLSRRSIDNPLFTRRGSDFSLSLQLTPPASLFGGRKDWKKLSEENTVESKKELYRWIEYWKLKFRSRTYTSLISPETTQWTPVLMTRADIGLLGSYNKYLKSPFETFYVGGDGMSGSYTYATETIALRGYDNGQFTPWGSEGYAYTRFGVELHFPLMLQASTTIYALTFLEGGNAWTSVKQFNPFSMKRSAGAGVRIFLPMVGMMGIDWAYGFDRVFGQKGGSHFHFILGQEF